jgi:alcohol dehydrogenase (cytochrome c)
MPLDDPGMLSDSAYWEIVQFIFTINGGAVDAFPLEADVPSLEHLLIPGKAILDILAAGPSGGLAPGVALPPWPAPEDIHKELTPVTDTMLRDPPAGSWLSWRRTQDGLGFSPLKKINKRNVSKLRVAWSLALTPGPNEGTPLVHDDVMYVSSYGDNLQALNAKTGDEIWSYRRQLKKEISPTVHRNIALYGHNVYLTTSDINVIALDARTGKVLWEKSIGDAAHMSATAGPLVANGVLMQGLTSGSLPGGSYIIGLNAQTGELLWRFDSIAKSGGPSGDSWNGLPVEERLGGSVWTAGSYDAEQGLAFFGPAPTYNTGPLRSPVLSPGITNHALYTDSTVALEATTGKLAWFYQHQPNDQWNLDWAFERQIVHIPIDGKMRKLVITAGKSAIYDALDAESGQYVFSFDLGLQNFVTSIDPLTGVKTVDPKLIPGAGEPITVCPHQAGGRNWLPGSYNPETHILYVPLVEACMSMLPIQKGEVGNLTTGVRWTVRPMPGSDGRYGRLQAINMWTRRTIWTERQRAPQTTGLLATAGGILFAGALNRWFTAYDANTGSTLWKIRLSDVPNSVPITYLVGDKQYVAIVVGPGLGQAVSFRPLVPEIILPSAKSSSLWVFELL